MPDISYQLRQANLHQRAGSTPGSARAPQARAAADSALVGKITKLETDVRRLA